MTKVAVLLASYNGERYIVRQLHSILCQQGVKVSIFVSDDCSSDRTIDLIESISASRNDVDITILSKDLKFGGAANNFFHLMKLVDVSGFDYVSLSDQDDIWHPDKLSDAINALIDSSSDGFSSNVEAYWPESGRKKLISKAQQQTSFDHWFESPGPGCTYVISVSSFRYLQEFLYKNPSVSSLIDYHDWFVYAFYRHNGFRWYISEKSGMLYVQHGNNEIGANSGVHAIIRRGKLMASGWYGDQIQRTYRLVAGKEGSIFSKKFLLLNCLKLRRKKFHSLLVFIYLIFK